MADTDLRALIQLIPPARALRKELKKSMDTESYAGLGNMAVRNLQGLLTSLTKVTDDEYVRTLAPDVPSEAPDKEKVAYVLLALSQLIAWLEGQAGIPSSDEERGKGGNINKPFNIAFGDISISAEGFDKVGERISKLFDDSELGQEIKRRIEEKFGKGKKEEPEE